MAIRCPHCDFEMTVKGARAGRFTPRCQNCGNTFLLLIPADPNTPATIARLDPAQVPAPAPAAPAEPTTLRGKLGDYQLRQLVGTGSTGEVYLAQESSTERNVAVKVILKEMEKDPPFVARVMREAFAGAQLDHHNLVRIDDIGEEGERHFFSMELLPNDVPAQTARMAGRLDAETAASYALQAARGLKYAHDRGMIHRDIKPGNLLLDDQGRVKVADLGMVKQNDLSDAAVTGMSVSASRYRNTLANIAVGTPSYMSPEQAQDAAHIDSRADIYSLGCTLYDLLTGRPPFMARTTIEIITKHQREPATSPDMIIRTVPRTLSIIVMKMLAKRPSERYQTMTDVIRDLENFLGVAPGGPYAPRGEQIAGVQEAVRRYSGSGWVVFRSQLLMGFYGACAVAAVVMGVFGRTGWMAAAVGLAVTTTIAYQFIVGATQRTYFFQKLRQLVQGASAIDWITWAILGGLAIIMLISSEWLIPWIGASFVGVLVALGFHYTVDQLLATDRNVVLEDARKMLRQLRGRGVDEPVIQQFVARAAGEKWEELFEALFGYETKLQMRKAINASQGESKRPRFGAWRDPILRYAVKKLAARRKARHRDVLEKLEVRALVAEGKAPEEALKLARQTTLKVIDAGRRLREGGIQKKPEPIVLPPHLAALMAAAPGASMGPVGLPAAPLPQQAARPESIMNIINRISDETIREAIENGDDDDEESSGRKRVRLSWFQRRFGTPLDLLIGKQVRFVLAVLILTGFGVWWRQNKVAPVLERAQEVANTQREVQVPEDINDITRTSKGTVDIVIRSAEVAMARSGSRELQIPYVSRPVRIALSGWNAGLAGLILLISVACQGRLMSLTVLLASAIALVGHWFEIPNFGVPHPWMSAAVAAGLAFVGMVFWRRPEGI